MLTFTLIKNVFKTTQFQSSQKLISQTVLQLQSLHTHTHTHKKLRLDMIYILSIHVCHLLEFSHMKKTDVVVNYN